MSSEVDICNLSLSFLGDEAGVGAITPPDGTVQAAHCARFYPIARGALLELHPWTFATKRVALSEVTNPVDDDWSYAYTLPSTCLRPLAALYPGVPWQPLSNESDNDSHPYLVEAASDGSLILYTNVETAVLRYIDLVTDTTKYTPLFTVALARLLAAYLAGPILKGTDGMRVGREQLKMFAELEYPQAAAKNANTGKRETYHTHKPAWLASRTLPSIPDSFVLREDA